jgi:hypothetical protein
MDPERNFSFVKGDVWMVVPGCRNVKHFHRTVLSLDRVGQWDLFRIPGPSVPVQIVLGGKVFSTVFSIRQGITPAGSFVCVSFVPPG